MAEQNNKKRWILGGLLTITLASAYFAPPLNDGGVALTSREQNAAPVATHAESVSAGSRAISGEAQDITVLAIKPRSQEDTDEKSGVFSSVNWTPARERVAVGTDTAMPPEIVQPPQAPPLPFKFMGKYTQNGIVTIFLQFKDQNLVVNVGDTIAENYKVESLNNGVLALNYLPLNQQQTLDVGAKN